MLKNGGTLHEELQAKFSLVFSSKYILFFCFNKLNYDLILSEGKI